MIYIIIKTYAIEALWAELACKATSANKNKLFYTRNKQQCLCDCL